MKKTISGLFFFCGLILICYALLQIVLGEKEVDDTLKRAEQLVEIGQSEIDEPKADGSNKDNRKTYKENEVIGVLRVPKINARLPIVQGTDGDNLKKGAGHYKGTAMPTDGEQIVLSGHRDTVFKNFKELTIGDSFIVDLPSGSFEYQIRNTEIVSADDRSVIRPRGEEVLTVTTCYPFNYLGNAPDRFVFYAYPVKNKA